MAYPVLGIDGAGSASILAWAVFEAFLREARLPVLPGREDAGGANLSSRLPDKCPSKRRRPAHRSVNPGGPAWAQAEADDFVRDGGRGLGAVGG